MFQPQPVIWKAEEDWGEWNKVIKQRAKKVVSNSLGLVDFTIGLVNSVLNLPALPKHWLLLVF